MKNINNEEIKAGEAVGFFHPHDGIFELGVVVESGDTMVLGEECILIDCATRHVPEQKRVWCAVKDVLV